MIVELKYIIDIKRLGYRIIGIELVLRNLYRCEFFVSIGLKPTVPPRQYMRQLV